jgi:hypothetical protein
VTDSAFLDDNLGNVWEELRKGASAVVARTVDVGAPPGGWSNVERAGQRLELEIQDVLCGSAPGRVTVDLPVVRGSRIAAAEPRLADWLATPGARAIHLLADEGALDEDLAALPADEPSIAAVRALCGAPRPPGPGSVASLAAEAVDASLLPPTVLDVVDGRRLVARLVSTGREAAAYAGIRADRLARNRAADAIVTPEELVRALRGEKVGALSAEVARALARAGGELERRQPGELERVAVTRR